MIYKPSIVILLISLFALVVDSNYWSQQMGSDITQKCIALSRYQKNEYQTPAIKTWISFNTHLRCDSESVFTEISFTKTETSEVTCNGFHIDRFDDFYNVTETRTWLSVNSTYSIRVTDYAEYYGYLNGNLHYLECGIIKGGKCDGDSLFGTGVFVADNQEGCFRRNQGVGSVKALYRNVKISGKCSSNCKLGSSVHTYEYLINNGDTPYDKNIGFSDELD